jgi:hypothetical protein
MNSPAKRMRNNPDPEMVSAAEIAAYSFCPEAWRLGSGLGLEPKNQEKLVRGEGFHEKTAVLDRRSQAALRFGVTLIAVGVLILGAYLLVVGR